MRTKLKMNSWLFCFALIGLLTFGCSETDKVTQAPDKEKSVAPAPDTDLADSPVTTPAEKLAAKDAGITEPIGTQTSAPAKKEATPAEPIVATDFPMPEKAEKPMYTSETNTIMFHQEGTVEDQATYYTEELDKLGWTKEPSSEVSDGVAFLDFSKGDLKITVTINPLREGMFTTIAQGSGISVPEALEADDEFEDEGDDGDEDEDDDDGDDN